MANARRRQPPKLLRPTLWDELDTDAARNLYCHRDDLSNEASVETFFIARLLTDLGYADSQIQTKKSLPLLTVGRGHKKERYRPDYALTVNDAPRWIVDAKGPDQNLDDWIEQCSGYCLALNRKYPPQENPVQFFVLSNGIATKVYRWDTDVPALTLDFVDFSWGNSTFEALRALLAADKVAALQAPSPRSNTSDFQFTRPTSEWARHLFALCHTAIWKSGYGRSPAFMEFIKVMFVKLWADRQLRDNPATKDLLAQAYTSGKDSVRLPSSSVIFSVRWIEAREAEKISNPLDTMIFGRLRTEIETNIELRKKKRLFDKDEHINLRPDVVKSVVARLEHYDMFGIDEDLNGRLFETFLSATMRGRELGQFFTPRSVVKMMARLADIRVDKMHQDKVIDACCGSGGFLIESLTIMRNQIRNNPSLSMKEKEDLLEQVCNECIYGIDFGKNPPIARIARINMYLHGDGGSRIYAADGLDKVIDASLETDPETVHDLNELRSRFHAPTLFDVVLTNPPFAMTRESKNETDHKLLQQYALAHKGPDTTAIRSSLRSSIMYLERYHDLLRPGKTLITVIDDTLLASEKFADVRNFIRSKFLVRAIISLPGDAFRRSGSRVKTSVLVLEKKQKPGDTQPSCFAFFSEQLGIDDLTPRASSADIQEARSRAAEETEQIVAGYHAYLRGKSRGLILPPERIAARLDLKFCVPYFGRLVDQWRQSQVPVKKLGECIRLIEEKVIPSQHPDELFKLVKVNYDGKCEAEKSRLGRAIKWDFMWRVKKNQILFSCIRATDGAIGIIPEEMDRALVSHNYYTFECDSETDAAYLWGVLRSHEIRADLQTLSPGSGRYRSYWPAIGEVPIPWVPDEQRRKTGQAILDTWALERQVEDKRMQAMALLDVLGVESEESKKRWRASKAPH